MNNSLHNSVGEIAVGKKKTSINIDEQIWKDFELIVLREHGNNKISFVLETLIEQYNKKNGGMQK